MTREEMWKEFEKQLIRETRTPITVSYDVSEKMTKSAIERTVAKWKERLEQEPKTDKYEYHTDHTDCIWYGNDSGCPTTCSQYRDGWNDAMKYIFKDDKGYQPYRRDEE